MYVPITWFCCPYIIMIILKVEIALSHGKLTIFELARLALDKSPRNGIGLTVGQRVGT